MNKTKKELIFDAALDLFVENGFHGTATSKIAQLSGVANGTLFQYFKTKDELVIELYIEVKDELAAFISSNSNSSHNIKETVKVQVISSLLWALDNQKKFQYIQQFQTSPYMNIIDKVVLERHLASHTALISNGIKQNIIKPLPIDLIYSLMSSQVVGLFQFVTTSKLSKTKQKETIETTFELLWEMIS